MIQSIRELVDESAMKSPHKIAVKSEIVGIYTEKTFSDLKADILTFGNFLISAYGDNIRLALVGENSYHWIVSYFTALYFGWVLIPIDRDLSIEDLLRIIQESDANVLSYGSTHAKKVDQLKASLSNICAYVIMNTMKNSFGYNMSDILFDKNERADALCPIDATEIAMIMFTSGTTGTSKGIMLSQKNLLSNCFSVADVLHLPKDSVGLGVLPFHHGLPGMCDLLVANYINGTLCINRSLRYLIDDIQQFKPTHIFAVPLIASTLIQKVNSTVNKMNLSNEARIAAIKDFLGGKLQKILCGGAMISAEIVSSYQEIGVTLIRGYGITECSPVVSITFPDRDDYDSVTIGTPLVCNKVKIIDGEICVSGDNVMKGYYKNPEATAAAFNGEWFLTGDLGYLDEKGDLYITGRKKNVIILDNGKNIYPEEIEEVLMRHDDVEECVVLEYHQHSNSPTVIAAIVRLSAGCITGSIATIISETNKNLPVYKRIEKYFLTEQEFEKTTTKKIIRSKVCERVLMEASRNAE